MSEHDERTKSTCEEQGITLLRKENHLAFSLSDIRIIDQFLGPIQTGMEVTPQHRRIIQATGVSSEKFVVGGGTPAETEREVEISIDAASSEESDRTGNWVWGGLHFWVTVPIEVHTPLAERLRTVTPAEQVRLSVWAETFEASETDVQKNDSLRGKHWIPAKRHCRVRFESIDVSGLVTKPKSPELTPKQRALADLMKQPATPLWILVWLVLLFWLRGIFR